MIDLDLIRNHIRNRPYMGGLERDALRIKALQEIFTPTPMVRELLEKLDPSLFKNVDQTFIDPTCGDGQFLGEVLIKKLENISNPSELDFENALENIYGVDIDQNNVDLCRDRLLCGRNHLRSIVERNIVQGDALTYDFNFGNPINFGNGLFELIDN